MDRLDGVLASVSRTFAYASALCLLVLIAATTADVTRRFLAGRPIRGTFEFTEIVLVALVFLGMGYAQRTDTHVSVRLLIARLPNRWSAYCRIFGLLVTAAIVGVIAVMGGFRASASLVTGEFRVGLARVPLWPARFALFAGTTVLFLEALLSIRRLLMRVHADECLPGAKDGIEGIEGIQGEIGGV